MKVIRNFKQRTTINNKLIDTENNNKIADLKKEMKNFIEEFMKSQMRRLKIKKSKQP